MKIVTSKISQYTVLPYQYVSQIPTLCGCHVCAYVCACMHRHRFVYTYITHTSEFKFPRVCQDISQKWIAKDTSTIPS